MNGTEMDTLLNTPYKEEHKNKLDKGKLDLTIVPPIALEAVAWVLQDGMQKYERNGWLLQENAGHRYYQAMRRHQLALEKGEMHCLESGRHHIDHVAANAMILIVLSVYNEDTWNWVKVIND